LALAALAVVGGLLCGTGAMAGVAGGGGVTVSGTMSVTFDNPTQTLDNIWILFDKGDQNASFKLPGSAPAGAVTTLSTTITELPIPGNPAFGIAATYGGGSPVGVVIGLDPGVAASLISGGATFDSAFFPGFSACTEGNLMAALAQTGDCLGIGSQQTISVFGADAYYQNNPNPYAGSGQLANFTGSGDVATLVSFSNAADVGRITETFRSGAVPEPAAWTMLVLGSLMAGAALRRRGHLAPAR
jgi:hypothetical protein